MPVTRVFYDNAPANWYNSSEARNPKNSDLRWELLAAGRDTTNNDIVLFGGYQFKPASWMDSGWAVQINQDNNVISLDIDSEATTADIINVSAATLTTGFALDINDADLLTTGQIARFGSNAPGTGTRSLITVVNDNTLATGTTLLDLDQDAAQNALFINHDAITGASIYIDAETTTDTQGVIRVDGNVLSTGTGLRIDADRLTTGQIAVFSSNGTDTGTKSLVQIIADNTSATGTTVLELQQDAAANALFIDHDAITGASIYIDAETTTDTQGVIRVDGNVLSTGTGLRVDADRLTTGQIAVFSSNGTDTGTKSLVQIISDNTLATGTTVLELQQDAAANVLFIDQDAVTGASIYIDAETTTDTQGVIRVDANVLTTGTGFRIDGDALSTGSLAVFASNSTNVSAKNLVSVVNDSSAAIATFPLNVQQDSILPALRVHITGTGTEALHFTGAASAGAASWFATTSVPAANLFLRIGICGTSYKIKLDDN